MHRNIFLCGAFLFLLVCSYEATSVEPYCPRFCNKNLEPVCTRQRDGVLRQFSNDCVRRMYNCENSTCYEVLWNGPCYIQH
ncbi:Vasotab [Frankliniella fusca]|uniref:Vasotab n=1 Tax=Frankliniella fusca TaxID=407009 RepID=A0AAE1I2P8_9NEOP|nr:Vasotab [Frankliniella fusca]